MKRGNINRPISTASAAPMKRAADWDTENVVHHYIYVSLSVLMSTRQAFCKSDECSNLDSYKLKSMSELLKIHLQAIGDEAQGTLLNVLRGSISVYENSNLNTFTVNVNFSHSARFADMQCRSLLYIRTNGDFILKDDGKLAI